MRKLIFILLAFIAVATFIRAYDYSSEPAGDYAKAMVSPFPDH